MQLSITLKAGQAKRQDVSAKNLVLLETGAASQVDLSVAVSGFSEEELRGVKRGLNMRTPGFTSITLLSAVDTTVELIATIAAIDVNYLEGATVKTIPQGVTLVSNDRGGPGNPMNVTAVTVNDSPAVSATNNAPVAVTPGGQVVALAAATRRELRFLNTGPDPIAIGAATGLTWATRVIVLEMGDLWVEARGANLAWSAVCDAGKSGSLNVQEVLS